MKHFMRSVVPVYFLFYIFAQTDVCLFVGMPETYKQSVGVFLLANSIAALCLSLPMFVSGRIGKYIAYFELLIIALIEFVEIVAKIGFGIRSVGGGSGYF